MNGYYTGKIKVVGEDRVCFPADPITLQALSCGCYDPFALSDPDPEPLETISLGEWSRRRAARRTDALPRASVERKRRPADRDRVAAAIVLPLRARDGCGLRGLRESR